MANVTGDTFYKWDTSAGANHSGRLAVKSIRYEVSGGVGLFFLSRSGENFLGATGLADGDSDIFYYDGKEMQDLDATLLTNTTIFVEWQD